MDFYTPIDCSFHDKLLELATFKKVVTIIYVDDLGVKHNITASLKDIYTAKTKEEFLLTSNNIEIRLDKLIQVGELTPPAINFCASKR